MPAAVLPAPSPVRRLPATGLLFLFAVCHLLLPCAVRAADPVKKPATPERSPEEFCLLVEPAEGPQVTRPIPGAKKTALVAGRETSIGGVRYYTAEEWKTMGADWDAFMKRAEPSATRALAALKPEFTKDKRDRVQSATLKSTSPLTASAVLAPGFLDLFKPTLGDDLVVLIPDRFTIHVFAHGFGDYQEFGQKVLLQYAQSSFPVSYEVFTVNKQGLKCIGSFRTE